MGFLTAFCSVTEHRDALSGCCSATHFIALLRHMQYARARIGIFLHCKSNAMFSPRNVELKTNLLRPNSEV